MVKRGEFRGKFFKKKIVLLIIAAGLIIIVIGILLSLKPKKENILTINKKVIAFDMAHGETKIANFSKFLNNFNESGMEIKYITSEITQDNLRDVDTLFIIIHPSYYSLSELDAIKSFLNKQKRMIILGDFVDFTDINTILSLIDNQTISLINCEAAGWDAKVTVEHEITKGVAGLMFPAYICLSLKENSSFKVVASNFKNGAIVAIREQPSKILVSGDVNFCDDEYIHLAHNGIFCKNIATWFSQ